MTCDRPPAARRRRFTSAVVGSAGLALLACSRSAIGPRYPVLAPVSAMLSFALVPFVGATIAPRLPRWTTDAPPCEAAVHRWLLLPQVMVVLDAIGWNTSIGRGRGAASTRAGLRDIDRSTRESIAAHGAGLVLHLVVTLLCLATRSRRQGVAVLSLGVVMHLYPVMIQRAVRVRLGPLLARL